MPRAGLDRQKILCTAIELANEKGIDHVTIVALANKLGVRPPSIYNHFRNLTEIHRQMAREGLQKLEDTLLRSVAGKSGEEAILSFSLQYLEFAKENPGLYEATISSIKGEDEMIEEVRKNIIQLLVRLLAPFSLEEQKALHLIRGLRSIVHGFSSLQSAGGFQMDFRIEDSLCYTIKTLCRGLKSEL
jgi:AcrR family transcriptional regulator